MPKRIHKNKTQTPCVNLVFSVLLLISINTIEQKVVVDLATKI